MKQNSIVLRRLRTAAVGALLAGSLSLVQAQTYTNVILGQFDTAGGGIINSFVQWWGDPTWDQSWDGAENATTTLGPNNAGSGAEKIVVHWNQTTTQNQLCIWQEVDGTQNYWVDPSQRVNGFYYDLSFDIKFDPASAKTAAGDYGHLQFGVSTPTWNQVWLSDFPHFNSNGWAHITCPIDAATPNIDQITAFIIYYPWQPGAINGDQTFWVDNIIFQTNLTKNIRPPTMGLSPVSGHPGLNLVAAAGQYSRDNIATASGDWGWVGNSDSKPVTYSFTISDYPPAIYQGFQTHVFLASSPGTENSPDWNEANCAFLDIQDQLNGSATATFRYKTNEPNNNSMMYGAGALSTITATNPIGTWTLSFLHDTNVTVTVPGGASTNFNFPDLVAVQNAFPPPVTAYFGVQPNQTANSGQRVTLSRVQISAASTIDDKFTGPDLDTNIWMLRADTPQDVFIVKTNDLWWLNWTLPDRGFDVVQVSPDLSPGSWVDTTLASNAIVQGSSKVVKIDSTVVPSTSHSYFRMVKRVPVKLQVLMPGETAAPNTPTGKTGTPLPQKVGVNFNVIVNAVDQDWNVIPSVTDNVTFTSSDPNFAPPMDAALVNGTATFSPFFATAGSQTLTATDTATTTIAPGTGTATTVTP
ncbi:MAG TPA: hypothetical protein VG146_11020 [Verrucomicrobiae bacterium]|nr:hypothetical protein [Verrucomicrobiae bacterium]